MNVKPYKTAYDCGNAYWMARLAKAVYTCAEDSDKPGEEKILADLQAEDPVFRTVRGFDRDSAQAMVVDHRAYIAVVFRGTDELADWLDNIDIRPTDALFGTFHRGFYDSVEDLWPQIDARVTELRGKKKRPVWFTGHSLGGAMATVAAARYVHEDRPFSGVYTFGQPRCMKRETARIFNGEAGRRVFRFQNNNDLVTRVPTRLSDYSHVGECIYISEEGTLHRDPGRWFKFLDAVDGAFAALKEKGFDGIEDHDMVDYLEAVKSWGNNPPLDD